jgi:hypothetical protein
MARVKGRSKETKNFGKGRKKKRRGRKSKGELPDPAQTRRVKNTIAQDKRVQPLREKRDERLVQHVQAHAPSTSSEAVPPPPLDLKVAFSKKLETLADIGGLHSPAENADDDAPQYGFVDIRCLNKMMMESPKPCPSCNNQERHFIHVSGNDNGLAMRLYLICTSCEEVLATGYSSQRIEGGNSQFDVNKRVVFAMRGIGCSFSELERFTMYMNMPSAMHHSTYITTTKNIRTELEDTIAEVLRFYGDAVKKAYEYLDDDDENNQICEDGKRGICVSYDGAWQKRFRGSKIGVGFSIDTLTGLVVDFDVLSTHCFGCQHAPSKDETDEDGNNLYEKWFAEHDPICSRNFEGSPQAMEQQLGLHLWERSIKLHDLRYTGYLGDGDTHTCDAINRSEVYGPDITVMKVDCINHVSKRMGTALRDYVQRTPATRLPDKGRFLKDIVPKLQGYYGKAIKNNTPSVDAMHDEIWAAWFHMTSTFKKPKHDSCPKGETSWCFHQRAAAKGETVTRDEYKKHDYLPKVVADGIKPIYEKMADKELLERCSKGLTTNRNEGLHHLLWNICPKEKFVSLTQVAIACIQAVHMFNEGHIGVSRMLKGLSLPVSPDAGARMTKVDRNREKRSQDSMCAVGRRVRSKRKLDASKSNAQKKKWEGTTYGYGLEGRGKDK